MIIRNKYNNNTLYSVTEIQPDLNEIAFDHVLSKMFLYTSW